MANTIYVNVRHWLFWYGVYGFCEKSCNDEIVLYLDEEKTNFLGHFDLLTQPCLLNLLNNEIDKNNVDKDFCDGINSFIRGSKDVDYSYIYPRNEEEIVYQVNHAAPINDKGHKPTYIYVYSKLSQEWDKMSVERIVRILANDFFHMNIEKVEFLETPTLEETKISYENDYEPYI
ncbi:hypothetical protein [Paenibacillus assamensis]|uniref:hypothetical protein n=1 Tax=Paenibacillus assamensis TaxID=311244 RepID=UPI00041C8975|nr:hypothetical protein [Paenibacillus assamensis]